MIELRATKTSVALHHTIDVRCPSHMDPSRRLLPLFPLPLVQFPAAVTPLHIFEPRYRKLLKDVSARDKTFGIIFRPAESEGPDEVPAMSSVGCSVEVLAVQELPDGRSNIVCIGVRRFRVIEYVEGEPYLQGEVEFFDDEAIEVGLAEEVDETAELFFRLISAGQKLDSLSGLARGELPELPGDPQLLSTLICSYLEIEMNDKQELLELLDTRERLQRVSILLERLVTDYEHRALIQELARKNGHSGPLSQNQ